MLQRSSNRLLSAIKNTCMIKGICHRDLKPRKHSIRKQKVKEAQIRLIDFGLAKFYNNKDSPKCYED